MAEVEVSRVCLVIYEALTRSEGTVNDFIYGVQDIFSVDASLALPGPSAGKASGKPWGLAVMHSIFLQRLRE